MNARTHLVLLVSLASLAATAGCAGPPVQSSDITGEWTSSTAEDLAADALNMSFLENGECRLSSLMLIEGRPVVVEVEGKERFARMDVNGAWSIRDGRIEVVVTGSSTPGWKPNVNPIVYEILRHDADKLDLDRGGERLVLFRKKP